MIVARVVLGRDTIERPGSRGENSIKEPHPGVSGSSPLTLSAAGLVR
jgi:hypothetical protein